MSLGLPASNSMPLMSEMALHCGAMLLRMSGQIRLRNWCGSTNTSIVAPLAALARLGLATTLVGSLAPGRYLTFSCVVLMISVRLLPSMSSSYTHIFISRSKVSGCAAVFSPIMRAMAEPQLPEPTKHTFSLHLLVSTGMTSLMSREDKAAQRDARPASHTCKHNLRGRGGRARAPAGRTSLSRRHGGFSADRSWKQVTLRTQPHSHSASHCCTTV